MIQFYYDSIPKYLPYDYINAILSNINSVEYFVKVKKKSKTSSVKDYYLKNETEDDYVKTLIDVNSTNILSFLKNDIEYYLKLKNFNSSDLNYINNKIALEAFFNKNNISKPTIDIFIDRLKKPILRFDRNQNGEKLSYSSIIKNDYTNIILMSRTDYFVLLPNNISIMTPNDLYLSTLPKNSTLPNYTLFSLNCIYNENINGVKISSIRHLGEIMKGDNNKKTEWIIRLNELQQAVYAYFKNNFNIDDYDKIFIYARYPEYKTQSLNFYAMYYGDFIKYNNMFYYMYSRIYLDDIIEEIRLSIQTGVDILAVKDYSFFTNNTIKKEEEEEEEEEEDETINKKNKDWLIDKKNKNKLLTIGGDSLPLNIDISKNNDKLQLIDYNWFFVEIKINSNAGYGFNDIIIYGKKSGKYYSLTIKLKKENIDNLENFYNLFANYYIGYFEFELILKESVECRDLIIITYNKSKYDDNYIINILKPKYDQDNRINIINDISEISKLLFYGIVPNTFSIFLKYITNNELFFNFNTKIENGETVNDKNKCLELLKLTLITKNNISELKYFFEFNNADIKIDNFTDNDNEETCKIVLLLDNKSYQKFDLDPTYDKIFDTVESYNNYFFNLFTKVLDQKNIIEYVGWFLPNNKFSFKNNITEVSDTDIEYLQDIRNSLPKCIIKYYKKLGIKILPENIILFFHMPSLIIGLHVRILIIKDLNKFLFQKQYLYSTKIRYMYFWNVISLLKLNIEYFKNYKFIIYPYNPTMLKENTSIMPEMILDKKMLKENTSIMPEMILDKKMLKENTSIITDQINIPIMTGGLNIKNNFKKWILQYINIKKIINIYKINNFFIDFEIKISYKNIININNYNKFIQYRLIMKDTLGNIFRNKLIKFFNINIGNFIIIKFLSLFKKNIKNNNILFIGSPWIINNDIYNCNIFYISDNKNFNNFNTKYEKTYFDIIHIINTLDIITKPNTICEFYLKNITSLIWAIPRTTDDGIIIILVREISTSINRDLLLLLSQFSDLYIYVDYTLADPTGLSIQIIIKNIKNKNVLINYLEEISKFECKQELSFLNIKNNQEQIKIFDNTILKISNNAFQKIFDYMKTYEIDKYNTNYPNISKENEELYLIKSTILFLIQKLYIENSNEDDYYTVFELIKNTKTKKILQIGMDNGIWSVFILTFFKFLYYESDELYKLISIDPYQIIEYKNIGIDNLKKLNLLKYHKLVDDYSFIYMQKLIDKEKFYDIIFINEWITYDYALTDVFISLKILNINGYLIIDGILNPDILKIISFIDKNYKNFKKINIDHTNNTNIVIYLKIE
jgi:hypothetical protein